MRPQVDLSIIVVNYNSADYVLSCIKSIREHTTNLNYEVLVVDNASFDLCGTKLAYQYPDVLFLQSPVNLGFGNANNLGAEHSKGDLLLFLNPDTEIKGPALNLLYDSFRKLDRPGAVGCRLLNSDGSLQTSCVQSLPTVLNQLFDAEAVRRLFPRSKLWGITVFFNEKLAPAEVEAMSGACIMMQRQVFYQVGGFSPEYFMYGEDLDLCYKTRRAGFRNYHVAEAVIIHHGSGSTKKSVSNFANVMIRESVSRFFLKFNGRVYSNFYRITMCGSAVIRLLLLGFLFPIWCVTSKVPDWDIAFRKWVSILRWGLGLEHWTRECHKPKSTDHC